MIFAREVSEPLTSLVRKLDEATAKNSKNKMGSFVVFLNNDKKATAKELEALAQKEHIDNTVLAVFKAAGPTDYDVSPDADVTVVLYVDMTVKVNHAYRKGDLKDQDVGQIVQELSKILPEAQ